jgi:HEAT repeat protein
MSTRLLCLSTLGFFLLGSMSLLAAPTKEEKDVDKYSKMLKTGKKPEEKVNALKELCRLGTIQVSLTKAVVPEIIKALDDKDEKVRAEAATTIGHIEPENKKEVIEKLRKMLKDEKEPEVVKHGIAEGLSAMASDAKDALPELRELNEKAMAKKKNGDRTYQMAIQAISGRKK